ncbi:cytochrome c family protein [Gaetbulibacter sp. 5U11]|nr:cytochrome c family protein [Gaetbulibacter sp. 5U11]
MKKVYILIVLSLFLVSCNNSKNKKLSAFDTQMEANKHPGKKLMETNCYTCHSPTASQSDRIGPPMIAIKKHYIDDNTTKEEFIADIQSWIKNPNAQDAKMHGAVKRFGVMPKQAFPEETIAKIADYMFDYDIDQPEWFEKHFNEEKGNQRGQGKGQGQGMHKQQAETNFEDLPYAERGLKYALSTKSVLGKNLMGTIQNKGTLEALAFCNEKAYPLTDSMSVVHNASIKRVSDKPRNQNNQANDKELTYINSFKNDIKNKKEPKPIVDLIDNKVHVYYPITTNTMCLQCHGKANQDIKKPTLNKLASLYPKDKALGYNSNEVRGIWSISFDK